MSARCSGEISLALAKCDIEKDRYEKEKTWQGGARKILTDGGVEKKTR